MGSIHDIEPHEGPPDREGWWVIALPTLEPYLIYVGEGTDPALLSLWQDGFKAWPLEALDIPQDVGRILTALVEKPAIFWKLAQAFSHLQLAGPWTAKDVKQGNGWWTRQGVSGEVLGWVSKQEDGSWVSKAGMMPRPAKTREEAQQVVDEKLRLKGYFLV